MKLTTAITLKFVLICTPDFNTVVYEIVHSVMWKRGGDCFIKKELLLLMHTGENYSKKTVKETPIKKGCGKA